MSQLPEFIAVINLTLKINAFFFRFRKTKFILRLVKLLIKNNYFLGYSICTKDPTKIIVFFKLNFEQNRPLMQSCKLISSLNRPIYIKHKQ